MNGQVILIFDDKRKLELSVDISDSAGLPQASHSWFEQQWESLGCEPLRVSGKVLLLDKILGVADALGHRNMVDQPTLANEFARHAILALEKPRVTVDIPGLSIVY